MSRANPPIRKVLPIFLKLKAKEIGCLLLILLIIAAFIFLPYWTGSWFGVHVLDHHKNCEALRIENQVSRQSLWSGEWTQIVNYEDNFYCRKGEAWFAGFGLIAGTLLIIFSIVFWLRSNWRQATKLAREKRR